MKNVIPSEQNENSHVKKIEDIVAEKSVSNPAKETNIQDYRSAKIDSATTNKTGISTYTQTTMISSPAHKPAYFHLSSSTSTTYLSPPEIILPTIIKNNKEENFIKYADKQGTPDNCCQKANQKGINEILRNGDLISSSHDDRNDEKNKVKPKKYKCRKHKRKLSRQGQSSNIKEKVGDLNDLKTYLSNFDLPNDTGGHTKSSKFKLSSIIKKYVHEVLKLNKEGMKAVEVATQCCSSVSTPGSSIINVSSNIDNNGKFNKISLQQIRDIVEQYIAHTYKNTKQDIPNNSQYKISEGQKHKGRININRKRKRVQNKHKIKSIYIAKKITHNSKQNNKILSSRSSTSTSNLEENVRNENILEQNLKRSYQKSLTKNNINKPCEKTEISQICQSTENNNLQKLDKDINDVIKLKKVVSSKEYKKPSAIASENYIKSREPETKIGTDGNTDMSTQTGKGLEYDQKYLDLEATKIKNMEKIASLTEKCTKRLFNLAKVLEEIRKNKSTTYISNTDTSQTPEKSDEKLQNVKHIIQDTINSYNKAHETQYSHDKITNNYNLISKHALSNHEDQFLEKNTNNECLKSSQEGKDLIIKTRCKPPTAVSRAYLKINEIEVVPHELSTVPEVDSTISQTPESKSKTNNLNGISKLDIAIEKQHTPKFPQNDLNKEQAHSIDPTKMTFIDLSNIHELAVQPFLSFEDYVKECNVGTLDEGSNLEDVPKEEILNDEVSSLHSDGSLPDVISELLKRNIISEPFKFDSMSNANSTTISSDSSISMFVLSRQEKKHYDSKCRKIGNKKKTGDTSDSMSISSNPDLESSFKKVGLRWASSTLKKTKERLALASSSSTSTSSTSLKYHPKNKETPMQNIPALVSDSLSNDLSNIKMAYQSKESRNCLSQNVEQQTSLTTSMTVKEFLTNELAKKITFTNNSKIDESEQHFTSLCSTKLPIDCINVSEDAVGNRSQDPSQPASRQRTSTPVQLYKSINYNTNSSSNNNSNGIFSNVDDLSSVKVTSSSLKINSNSDNELSIPNYSLRLKKKLENSDGN